MRKRYPGRREYTATLECGHEITFTVSPPLTGDELWCFRCEDMFTVAEAPYEYSGRCLSCKYAPKHTANVRTPVLNRLRSHAQPLGHRVELREGHTVVLTEDYAREKISERVS